MSERERGCWRTLPRRPRAPAVLELRRRAGRQVSEPKVSVCGGSDEGDGTEDDDGEWNFVGDCGDRPKPDPIVDLRPIGVRSKFWALAPDDDFD